LWKFVKSESWTVGTKAYTAAFTSSASATCPAGEAGFQLNGTLTVPAGDPDPVTIVACILSDTGPNTTGNFISDVGTELGGGPTGNAIVIETATLDPANSTINFG
jgi:hypothetical protein